ncbi:MAG: hypothetical protein M3Z23_01420 [Acidobacteriota bacterium]|nr:hypothetical protein [Acidobacteriota bacterium]
MPDSVAAAAFAIAVAAGGACKHVKTTPLLTVSEGTEAMKKAATCGYQPALAHASKYAGHPGTEADTRDTNIRPERPPRPKP